MGWKDLMKNVTDKATSVAETAQAKFEEQKQLSAIKKEEQNKKMEEMNERVTEYEQELLHRCRRIGKMKRKICFVTIAVMVLSLIGCGSKESTDDASAQEEKQNKAKIEEAMENEDYDKAKTLTANDSNYKDLYKDLEAYLMVANDIRK